MLISMIVMGVAIAGAGATFAYQLVLGSIRDQKADALAAAEASISRATVDEFLRLHNRLNTAEVLLDEHIAVSQYLDVLETLALQTVSFDSMELAIASGRVGVVAMEGSARSFNALAAQSAAFAAEKRIKRAIFSDISAGETGLVTFSLTAELDPSLVTWDGVTSAAPVELPVESQATTTAP